MDIPDTFLATTLLLNVLKWDKIKTACFAILLGTWTSVHFPLHS